MAKQDLAYLTDRVLMRGEETAALRHADGRRIPSETPGRSRERGQTAGGSRPPAVGRVRQNIERDVREIVPRFSGDRQISSLTLRRLTRPSVKTCKEASMNTLTPAPPENIATDLVRRGLPVDYAQRATAELADHHRDLVAELRAVGLDETAASTEAVAPPGRNAHTREKDCPRVSTSSLVRPLAARFVCSCAGSCCIFCLAFRGSGIDANLRVSGPRWPMARNVGSRTRYDRGPQAGLSWRGHGRTCAIDSHVHVLSPCATIGMR